MLQSFLMKLSQEHSPEKEYVGEEILQYQFFLTVDTNIAFEHVIIEYVAVLS